MTEKYDLEERTLKFARDVRLYVRKLKKHIDIQTDITQLIRSSGSVGANYIEANDALSKKDFLMRIRICLKEAKEAQYWLLILYEMLPNHDQVRLIELVNEAQELRYIFATILKNTLKKDIKLNQ
jgi:four helix bundle protein